MVLPARTTTPRPTTTTTRGGLYSSSLSNATTRKQPHAVTPAAATTTTTTVPPQDASQNNNSDDAFFLCWGSSINVNEDLRRSIRNEVEEINASMQITSEKIGAATQIQNQLDRDLFLALEEMSQLGRGMADNAQMASVHEQLQSRYNAVLDDYVVAGDLEELRDTKNSVMNRIKTLSEQCAESKRAVEAESREIESIEARIESEGLETLLKELEEQVRAQEEEKRKAEQENFAKSQALDASRARCNEYQDQIDKNTVLLNEQKAEHEKALAAKTSAVESKKLEVEKAQHELVALEKTSDDLSASTIRLQEQLVQAESMRIAKTSATTKLQELAKQNKELEAQTAKLQQEVVEAQAKVDATVPVLQEIRNRQARVAELKQENDDLPNNESELDRLVAEKEKLQKDIADLAKNDKIDATHEAIAKIQQELESLEAEHARLQQELQDVTRQQDELKEQLAQAQLQDNTSDSDLLESLENTIQDKHRQVEMLKAQITKQTELAAARAELDATHQVYLVGKELVETTHETVNYLVHEPLQVDQEEEATVQGDDDGEE